MDRTLRNLTCRRVQCDEIWSFCYAKAKNVPSHLKGTLGFGDVWTWVAMDADTKLVLSYLVGSRGPYNCYEFIKDVASRLASKIQLSTDGLYWYVDAVDHAFGIDVDYGMIEKHYGGNVNADAPASTRYSPPTITAATKRVVRGNPEHRHISTSHIERQNLTMRMSMRRFTRLTNGFSKKLDNHMAAIAIYYLHYNFCRIHQTLRVTPAMAAGVSDHVWELSELVGLLDAERSAVA